MNMKKWITIAILLMCVVSFVAVPAMAKQDKDQGDKIKTPKQKSKDKLEEHKEKKIVEQKKTHKKADFIHEVPGVGNLKYEAEDVPDGFEPPEETITMVSWHDKGKLHIRDTVHKTKTIQVPWSTLQEVEGFDGEHVRVWHYNDAGGCDGKWVQTVSNEGGYAYLEDVPFSEVVVGGYTGTYTKSTSETITINTSNSDGIYTESLGREFDPADISFLNMTVTEFNVSGAVVGFEWDTSDSSPSLRTVDVDGSTLENFDFDGHPVWGNMRRCVIDPDTETITYGDNARGDGLTLNGSAGNVMVEIPRFYIKFENTSVFRGFWISPYNLSDYGFEVHPAFVQRGGKEVSAIYVSAYDAAGFDDSGTFKLRSATGLTPVTGGVSYTDLPNSGRFTIDDAELYAGNIGSGYGCMNVWTMSAIRLLFYTEFGSLDSQSALDRGVVDLAAGTDFAGLNTGANSADTNIGTNGTGTGTGTDGETPIVYRGIENVWGNVWKFIIGYNAVDAEYRITNRDGSGTLAGDLAAGQYEASTAAPITTDGYGIDVATESLLQQLMIPDTVGGSTSTYLSDYFYTHDAGETNILLSGGSWADGSSAGVGYLSSTYDSSHSFRYIGARFEFIPQLAESVSDIDVVDSNIQVKTNSNISYSTELDGTGTVSIPYSESDATIDSVSIISDLYANMAVDVVVGYTEDTYLIEEFCNEGFYEDQYAVEISHTPSADNANGLISYNPTDSMCGDIMSKSWDYELESNNPAATITTFNQNSLVIDTGAITAGTEYSYTVIAEADHTYADGKTANQKAASIWGTGVSILNVAFTISILAAGIVALKNASDPEKSAKPAVEALVALAIGLLVFTLIATLGTGLGSAIETLLGV